MDVIMPRKAKTDPSILLPVVVCRPDIKGLYSGNGAHIANPSRKSRCCTAADLCFAGICLVGVISEAQATGALTLAGSHCTPRAADKRSPRWQLQRSIYGQSCMS